MFFSYSFNTYFFRELSLRFLFIFFDDKRFIKHFRLRRIALPKICQKLEKRITGQENDEKRPKK